MLASRWCHGTTRFRNVSHTCNDLSKLVSRQSVLILSLIQHLQITKVVLTLKEGRWWIELPLAPTATRSGSIQPPRWLKSVSPPQFITLRPDGSTSMSSVTCVSCSLDDSTNANLFHSVRHRPHNVQVSLTHQAPAYVGEEYPIVIEVINTDDRTLEITTDVLLQPSEIEAAGMFKAASCFCSQLILQ